MLNSDYAGHRLTLQLFAQSPSFTHLAAVCRNFDRDGPLEPVRISVLGETHRAPGGSAASLWFDTDTSLKTAAE